eukprot:TRINITY_DN17417_c0_g1_i1.p1 TRINITY_DN17417_c0_g1~~TRINITY_DN17417_c0_g1_i1.p1  ORF type:complete len:802 (-),score=141.27 TRINITY_DN17417_c0_g1_i1:675-3080(-)
MSKQRLLQSRETQSSTASMCGSGRRLLGWLLAWLSLECAPAWSLNSTSWGNPACPCLNFSKDMSAPPPGPFVDHLASDEKMLYGIGCAAHDNHPASPFCGSDPDSSAFCGDAWCYTAASAEHVKSDHAENQCILAAQASIVRPGFYYSYATCGYSDKYTTREHLYDVQRGRTLRVANLFNTGGWKGSYCEETGSGVACAGPVQHFLHEVMDLSGAKKQTVATFFSGKLDQHPGVLPDEVVQEYRRQNPNAWSTFDACALAAGMGYVDICIGSSVGSLKRREMTSTLELYSEPVYLVTTRIDQSPTILDYLRKGFAPFSKELWGTLFGVILLFAAVVGWQERDGLAQIWSSAGGRNRCGKGPGVMIVATISTLNAFVTMPIVVSNKRSMLFTNLGLGTLAFFVMTTYTASLSADMIVNKLPVTIIDEWSDILAKPEHRVCFLFSLAQQMSVTLQLPQEQAVPSRTRTGTLEGVGSECDAAAVMLEDFEAAQSRGQFCNLMRVGDPLFYVDIVAPVSERTAKAFEVFKTVAVHNGKWREATSLHKSADICALNEQESKHQTGVGLPVMAMFGPIVISIICLAVGFFFRDPAQSHSALSWAMGMDMHRPSLEKAKESDRDHGHYKAMLGSCIEQMQQLQEVLETRHRAEIQLLPRLLESRPTKNSLAPMACEEVQLLAATGQRLAAPVAFFEEEAEHSEVGMVPVAAPMQPPSLWQEDASSRRYEDAEVFEAQTSTETTCSLVEATPPLTTEPYSPPQSVVPTQQHEEQPFPALLQTRYEVSGSSSAVAASETAAESQTSRQWL